MTTTKISLNGAAKFLDDEREREAKEREVDQARYYAMLPKCGKHDAEEKDEFRAIRQRLGITLDDLQNHLTIRASFASLSAEAKKVNAASDEVIALDRELAELNAAYEAEVLKYVAAKRANDEAQIQTRYRLDRVLRAKGEAEKLVADHWQLLGAEDPSERTNCFHLILGRPDITPHGEYPFITIQQIMAEPKKNGNPNKLKFVLMEGQTEAELTELRQIWLDLYNGAFDLAVFLVGNGYAAKISIVQTANTLPMICPVSDAMEAVKGAPSQEHPPVSVERIRFINPPDQDSETFESLIKKVQAAKEKGERERRRWKSSYQGDPSQFEEWEREQQENPTGRHRASMH